MGLMDPYTNWNVVHSTFVTTRYIFNEFQLMESNYKHWKVLIIGYSKATETVTFICYRNSATQINQLLLFIVGIDCRKRREPNSGNTHARNSAQ